MDDGGMDEQVDGRENGCMDGWMDGWSDGWVREWRHGWVDGWVVNQLTEAQLLSRSRHNRIISIPTSSFSRSRKWGCAVIQNKRLDG